MKNKGMLYTILSGMIFGITPALASYTYKLGSNAQTLTFYRDLMVVPVLLLILLIGKISIKITGKQLLSIVLVGLFGKGMTTLSLYASYDYVGVGVATTLHFLYPVFVALICFVLFKDKMDIKKLIALGVASLGVLLFFEKGAGAGMMTGVALAVFSAITYAIYMIGIDKTGLKNLHPMVLTFYLAIVVSSSMLLYNIPTRQIVFQLSAPAFLYTFIIAISTSILAVSMLQMGIKYLSATTAAIFSLFEPVTGCIAGSLFLGEQLTTAKIIGCIVILGAVTYLSLEKKSGKSLAST